jgi:caffeoyl-CoA O-methyltransferase
VRAKYLELTPELHDYVVAHGARQDELLARVEAETEALGQIAVMQIAPDQGALLTLLVRAIGARRAIELGTFTGYSAICIARGLEPGGKLTCCEISEEYARTAQANLGAAGLSERVEIRVGPAAEALAELEGPIDFAFVDADKTGYPDYYEALLGLLRPGGLIAFDNMLLSGRVLQPAVDDESAKTIAALNERIAADERVDCALLTIADGVTIVRRRP